MSLETRTAEAKKEISEKAKYVNTAVANYTKQQFSTTLCLGCNSTFDEDDLITCTMNANHNYCDSCFEKNSKFFPANEEDEPETSEEVAEFVETHGYDPSLGPSVGFFDSCFCPVCSKTLDI